MKKISAAVLITALIISTSVALEVPNYGENLYELSSPTALTGGVSVTGGALFSAGSESLIANPALISKEQRIKLNLADTFLFSTNSENSVKAGDAFQLGLVIPSKMFVAGAYINGTFVNLDEMNLGNSLTLKGALAKEITDKLSVGLGISTAVAWTPDVDWALNADLGFLYDYGNLGFLRDFRYGVSVLNLGKTFGNDETGVLGYPTLGTFKAGVAASLLKNQYANLGFAVDVTTPLFQNLIADAGLQLCVKDMVTLGVTEKFNLAETIKGNPNYIPSVSLNFKFTFDFQKKASEGKSLAGYMEKHDWAESEFCVGAGWKQFYGSVEAVSVGADLSLGLKDTTPPVIEIKFADEDEEE